MTGSSSRAGSRSGSLRGATGHEHSPFLAVRRAATTEDAGEAFALSLVYSGNFLAEAEVDPFGTARLRIGIHPEAFAWRLEPGATFTTPEAVIAWSGDGLGALSEALHGLYRERLARGPWRDRPRPVVLNNWEATYFDFDHDRIVGIARRRATWASSCSSSTTAGSGVATTTTRRSATGSSTGASCRTGSRRWQGRQGPGASVRPLDRARDGQRGQRPVPRPSRLGDRRPRPAADGEPAAARARLRATRGRRPHRGRADRGALERADRLRQVGHEPLHHRAVDARRSRPTARASSSTATSSACTSCTGA